jgi:hypothetical protein
MVALWQVAVGYLRGLSQKRGIPEALSLPKRGESAKFAAGPKHAAITSPKDGRGRTNPTAGNIRNTAHSMRMANTARSRNPRRDRDLEVTSSTGQGH